MINDTNKQVQLAMKSIEGVSRAEAPPFMLGRVLVRIRNRQKQTYWEKGAQFIARPAFAVVLVLAVILLNIYFFSGLPSGAENYSTIPADEYLLTGYAVAENENVWP